MKLKFRILTDDDLTAFLLVHCPSCSRAHKKKLGRLGSEMTITCLCGSMLTISSEALLAAAKRVKGLQRLIEKLENQRSDTES